MYHGDVTPEIAAGLLALRARIEVNHFIYLFT